MGQQCDRYAEGDKGHALPSGPGKRLGQRQDLRRQAGKGRLQSADPEEKRAEPRQCFAHTCRAFTSTQQKPRDHPKAKEGQSQRADTELRPH